MTDADLPQYMMIASDLASRIVQGEFTEGQRLSGRTLLSSEYSVSPETIRRALALLADMKVVSVKHNIGVFILSADNARRYLNDANRMEDQLSLQSRFKELTEQQLAINTELLELTSNLMKAQNTFSFVKNHFPIYEAKVPENSHLTGRSIGSLRFWQNTGGATIVAIRRQHNVVLSPGPYAELYAGDVLLFVGQPEVKDAVDCFVRKTAAPKTEKQ